MKKQIEWSEHKAPPIPIMENSTILTDSLYLYGVDFMSTSDVQYYFKSFFRTPSSEDQSAQGVIVKWINDSSCVIQLPSEQLAKKVYHDCKLTDARDDDKLPPLDLYLRDLKEIKKRE